MPDQPQQPDDVAAAGPVSGPDLVQTPAGRVRLKTTSDGMTKSYTNAFRTRVTAEEVVLDFGLNTLEQSPEQGLAAEVQFQLDHRLVMTYPTAKRLAIALSKVVRAYEERFGEVSVDSAKRASEPPSA